MKSYKETVLVDPSKGQTAWESLERKASDNLYFQRFIKEMKRKLETEGTLQGNVTSESDATNSLGLVYNQIITGLEKHAPLDFARVFTTDKAQLLIPVGTHGTAVVRASDGTFSSGVKTQSPVTVNLNEEYGLDTSWTKAHLDDATWDVMAEQNENAGYAIQVKLCERLVRELQTITLATAAGGAKVTIANQSAITFAEFKSVIAAVDIAGTGPADYVVCSPKRYWQLMGLDQFVNTLYAGTDSAMRTGIAKSMLGVTVVRVTDLGGVVQLKYTSQDTNFTRGETVDGDTSAATGIVLADRDDGTVGLLTLGTITGTWQTGEEIDGTVGGNNMALTDGIIGEWSDIFALNSKKALALVYRRALEIEPFQYPDQNRYGFTTSVRAKTGTLVPSAVSVGHATAA